ncbi:MULTISPECIES: YtxH domain-containing protein [Aequorivita]|uniref:YtxH domain-containing protein n=1 Tax=Aequorivita iocasae TaxID=2803865 RepID=A0ABX7DVG5_9FLAO|nr:MULTISPECIES: YtxH domain-containing protein [Aequorivita]QQX77626.1 YtxH domain-containing protein [Aequorivita iocasae]UCA57123.1 YtxH domain-containing protein [Aequorivita sp. F7]
MASNTGQTLLALLTGAAIGAGIGILYAPDKGSKTRDKLSKEAKKAQKKLNKQIQETSSTLSDRAQRAKISFEQKLNETLSSASYKADDILLAMEDKLEALRKQNAKLQIDAQTNKAQATAKKVTS